ncbi:hypothetical protein [Planifilum fimeticola]|nr:hypothetical protein [Planifilum fimeticola]
MEEIPMLSPCCNEKIRVEFREEYYHCCDDGYPLKVPYLVCARCGTGYAPRYTADEQRELTEEGESAGRKAS